MHQNGEWFMGGRGCSASPITLWPRKGSTGCALSAGYSQSGWECGWRSIWQLCAVACTKMVNGSWVGGGAAHRQSLCGHERVVLGVLCRLATHNPVGSVAGAQS